LRIEEIVIVEQTQLYTMKVQGMRDFHNITNMYNVHVSSVE